ncbi:hypothetical protein JCM14036_03810 [Desulfotomaculum defluvii]
MIAKINQVRAKGISNRLLPWIELRVDTMAITEREALSGPNMVITCKKIEVPIKAARS